jgi:ribosomal protein L11 methyltransferase
VDVGTGSGILSIAAAKLGWSPIFAFDNDPIALTSARENVEANQVADTVEVYEADVSGVAAECFAQATVLANMTLEPVTALVRKLRGVPLLRLVVSGVLAGAQEYELVGIAREYGLSPARRLYEGEWVSMELLPVAGGGRYVAGDRLATEGAASTDGEPAESGASTAGGAPAGAPGS